MRTTNPNYGFYGTIRHHADPEQAWMATFEALQAATKYEERVVGHFLDSRRGRHFADSVAEFLADGAQLPSAVGLALVVWGVSNLRHEMSRVWAE